MNGIPYKDTFAAKGSDLYKALEEKDQKKAKTIYDATTKRMKALTPEVTIKDLIELASSTTITDKHIKELNERIEAFDKREEAGAVITY